MKINYGVTAQSRNGVKAPRLEEVEELKG